MFVDCEKASKRLDRSVDDSIVADAFVQVCDSYGLHMRVQATVLTSSEKRGSKSSPMAAHQPARG